MQVDRLMNRRESAIIFLDNRLFLSNSLDNAIVCSCIAYIVSYPDVHFFLKPITGLLSGGPLANGGYYEEVQHSRH